ncbi:MAG TPA: hypothetical protein VK815_16650 [Candidatus Acidoferrales bacterium]|nr:hypothetical protein [Candidatus Acidoferrales bacterium]
MAEIKTIIGLPGGIPFGFQVSSRKLIDGRNTRFDSIEVYRTNAPGMIRRPDTRVEGGFWANDYEGKQSLFYRRYELTNREPFQVSIDEDVSIEIADKAINTFIKGDIEIFNTNAIPVVREGEANVVKREIKRESRGQLPWAISRVTPKDNHYRMSLTEQCELIFIYQNGKVLFIRISRYDV